jgi:TatA/E family protein of Tat protein translocase
MLGMQEVVLILAILLLVFGPTKLPKIARELGKAIHEFNKASSGLMKEVTSSTKSDEEKRTQILQEIADKLDLNTAGKTRAQVKEDVITKVINMEETVSTEDA